MTVSRVSMLMVLSLVLSGAGQTACAGLRDGHVTPRRIERDIKRFRIVGTDNVMELLAIRPGMTILDIGAGTGQFAYEFARRLNGTGNVYATDAQAPCVDFMKKEAGKRGLDNLHPILVGWEGLDEFYGKHRYDLITLFHVSIPYDNQIAYLKELRGYLTEGGRLALILYKSPVSFSVADFARDFRGLIEALLREPPESPFGRLLNDPTRKWIREHPDAELPEGLKKAVTEGFNEALHDADFPARFLDGPGFSKDVSMLPEERSYAEWLLLTWRGDAAENRVARPRVAPGDMALATLNKLLIVQRNRRFIRRGGLFTSGFTPRVRAAFEKAGYRIEREYPDLIPFEDLVIFSAR
jgi:SAM-dependent methyltransferase